MAFERVTNPVSMITWMPPSNSLIRRINSMPSTFGMSMKMGLPYSMTSEVIEFEENRRIAWQTKPPVSWGAR